MNFRGSLKTMVSNLNEKDFWQRFRAGSLCYPFKRTGQSKGHDQKATILCKLCEWEYTPVLSFTHSWEKINRVIGEHAKHQIMNPSCRAGMEIPSSIQAFQSFPSCPTAVIPAEGGAD